MADDLVLQDLSDELDRAERLADQQQLAEARDVLVAVHEQCERLGVESAYLSWRLCVIFDQLKEPELAFTHVREALRLDPLASPFRESFGVIAAKLRKVILAATPGADESVPRLYAMLVEAGESTNAVHVAMARHFSALGQHGQALVLVNAVTVLSPHSREAWLARAAICRALGDEPAALEAESRVGVGAAGAASPRALFGIPGRAMA